MNDDQRMSGVVERPHDIERSGFLAQDRAADLQHHDIAHVMYSALMRTYSADRSQPHATA